MPRLNIARSRTRDESCRRTRIAQISFSFSGGFWPVNLPLFHGTRVGTVSTDVLMTISFQLKGDPVCIWSNGRYPTHKGRMLFSTADARTSIASLKYNDSGQMEAVLIILNVEI
ncbi:hypothetical protein LMG28614_07255 [Paraburkholderia ultramafica]|uniref:Uncharacterized protein n=1 Tax=Paraburkholderia ultramafica TaxID=1544867 RepID=A0A6S7BQU6_9BURK|nr:hypothetical protein LMG28614_07255 [Paraburkholderia ultramafica]